MLQVTVSSLAHGPVKKGVTTGFDDLMPLSLRVRNRKVAYSQRPYL